MPHLSGIIRHEKGRQFLSAHIDDMILVAEEEGHYKFIEHFSNILKLKAGGFLRHVSSRDVVRPQEEVGL